MSAKPGMVADNLVHFVRILRAAGLSIGPQRSVLATQALLAVGIDRRDQVHAALASVLLTRHEDQRLFDMAFAAFWRDPKLLERMMYLTLPKVVGRGQAPPSRTKRLDEALAGTHKPEIKRSQDLGPTNEPLEIDAIMTFSDRERLQAMDFEAMNTQEYAQAKHAAAQSRIILQPLPTRRAQRARRGKLNLRDSLRVGAQGLWRDELVYSRMRTELPRVVVLCDISGSMERYARLFLHWVHALARQHPRVETFTMGTRLTQVTKALRARDVDQAMFMAGQQVKDWSGGTRLAGCLQEFNHLWARRLLSSRSVVVLLTDGLDRDDSGSLSTQAQLLKRFARRVLWLNPLLRFDGFEPKASGIRALLPHVDEFIPAHNLSSLQDLSTLLARAPHAQTHH
jgi:uncharacterized protein